MAGNSRGTAIDNHPLGETNPTYDGLLAIWCAFKGSSTGWGMGGTPAGWQTDAYWSATPSAYGHADVYFDDGDVDDGSDGYSYVALEVG